MARNPNHKLQRGMSITEALLASSITVITLAAGVGVFLSGMNAWYRGEGMIDAESTAQRGVRILSKELREAMVVNVAANGTSLTYRRAAKDSSGNYKVPIAWDGVSRSVDLAGDKLRMDTGGKKDDVCRGVITTDPSNGNAPYKIFTPGAGSLTRSLTIQLVTERKGPKGQKIWSRSRETVYLRNVPELTQ